MPRAKEVAALVIRPDGEEGPAFVEGDRITPIFASKKGARPPLDSPMHATWALARGANGILFIGTASGLYFKDGVFERASLSTARTRGG